LKTPYFTIRFSFQKRKGSNVKYVVCSYYIWSLFIFRRRIMPKVTIIIPVLNVRPYIRECLDSVVGQTLTDIEVFCVDAGSTDGTLEIEQEYAAKDPRLTILDDTARSTGYAKNIGIDRAQGKYVAIVESDDYIAKDMMEKLYRAAEQYGLDMVKGNYRSFMGEGGSRLYVDKAISLRSEDYEKVINPQADNRYFGWDMYTWTGLYKKEFLDKYHIRHNESKGAAFQDVGFWFQTFCYGGKVYLLNDYFYHYRRDNPNASVNHPSRTFAMCEEYQYVKNLISRDAQTWKRVLPAYYHEMFRSYFVTYERLADPLKDKFVEKFYKEIREGYERGQIQRELFDPYELEYLDALLGSKQKFMDRLAAQKSGIEKKQAELYERIKGYSYCIIFSAGSHGSNLQIMLKHRFDKDVTAFCDNDVKKRNAVINGAKVLDSKQAEKLYSGAVYLVANKKHGSAIHRQLLEEGIAEERIVDCKVEELIDGFM